MNMASSVIDLTEPTTTEVDLTQSVEEEDPSLLLGSFELRIVGIRYYQGVAHPGEFVVLCREPNNPYDRNAIQVQNMHREKVGHVKGTTAQSLAPVMDRIKHIKIDGTIPRRGTAYEYPCTVEFYGRNVDDMTAIDDIFRRGRQTWSMNKKLLEPAVTTKTVDWKKGQQNLDDVFDKLNSEQLKNLPDIAMPTSLTATLLEHQVQGIQWLVHRETAKLVTPFFREAVEKGRKVWVSDLSNTTWDTEPVSCKGSILADDMGLGKSLQAIVLLLANPPKGSQPKTTLILCPVSVLQNWQSQISQHLVPDTLKVAIYHGPDRHSLLDSSDWDVLITPYGTVSSEYGDHILAKKNPNDPPKKKKRKSKNGPSIFDRTFFRVILDEAHIIRNPKSRTFAACCALQAVNRLCLTGTPLQNKSEDIYSLFSFLRVPGVSDRDIFRRAISQPIEAGDAQLGLGRLRTMMAHTALRRNKSKLELTEKTVELRSISFHGSVHEAVHQKLFESARAAFRYLGDAAALKNYMMILETLTRIRQACVSGALVPQTRLDSAEKVLAEVQGQGQTKLTPEEGERLLLKLKGALEESVENEAVECAICMGALDEDAAVILRSCNHVFCGSCLSRVAEGQNPICPFCRQPFQKSDMVKGSSAAAATKTEESTGIDCESLGASPKMVALGLAISEMESSEKGVIFSQFTKFLDILEPFLADQGHTFVRIDGSKTAKQRMKAMDEFAQVDGPRFILCSLHAAGTGITLTRANHVYLMDTWWNHSTESQAMDRVHRIGQTRPVRVVRFVMKDSIEERMIALQEQKATLGKGALEKLKPEEVRKARIGDLKSLFDI